MRYKFYREHKYVSFRFNQVERLIAQVDFTCSEDLTNVTNAFENLIRLLEAHAHYENAFLHPLLKKRNSTVYEQIEEDHKHLDEQIAHLRSLLRAIESAQQNEEKIEAGYQFYLWFRKFNGDNLIHLHEEETIILPELQRLYSDEELKQVEAAVYQSMTAQDLIDMLEDLFPHMNVHDWEAFLKDIKDAVPATFKEVWHSIKKHMTPQQQAYLEKKLSIN